MSTHWIVIADSARARLFQSDASLDAMEHMETLHHPESRQKSGQLVSDNSGRDRRGGSGGTLSGPSAHDHELDVFSRELAETLEKGFDAHRFERLVLAAPANFLGKLRGHLSTRVAGAVVASMPKDYSRLPSQQLAELIRSQLPDDAGLPSGVH